MKTYVVDANVLFSALISSKTTYYTFFSKHEVLTTDFLFIELEKYRKTILKKSKLTEQELFEFSVLLFKHITVIPSLSLSQKSLEEAYDWCGDIDSKDVLYVALTIQSPNSVLITRDLLLYKGLISRGFNKVVLFQDVFEN